MKFCKLPFESLYILPNGNCRVCGWTDAVLGNLEEEDLETIWHSKGTLILQEAMRKGNFEYCRNVSCPYLENDSLPEMSEEEAMQYPVQSLPINFNVACDYICNHSCPSCRSEVFVPNEQYQQRISTMIEKLLPYLNRKETEYVATDGCGDCFASPHIMNMLEKLHPENQGCVISLETNGALLDEKHWERISHLGKYYTRVTVTPNSFTRSTFKYLNGGHDTYDQVIHNLGFMRELKHKGEINEIAISIVIQERNFFELPEFANRCMEEFDANRVIVKPLYKWFRLSDEDYWFKDVLNPMHPYHKEFLSMLENPILKDPRVYFWGGEHMHESRPHPAFLYKEHMEITRRLLDGGAGKLEKFMEKMGIHSVYLYGDVDLATIFYKVLENSNIDIRGFLARDVISKDGRCGQRIQCLCDYDVDDVDAILVMNYNWIKRIKSDLHFIGFHGKILTAKELIECFPV